MDYLHLSPINCKHIWFLDFKTVKDHGLDDFVQRVHLRLAILEVALEALSLKKGNRVISLVELRFEGML
jgi:hypothetical protein